MTFHVSATSATRLSHHALPLGGQELIKDTSTAFHPPNDHGLAASAMHELMQELRDHGVFPSSSMTAGLEAAAGTLEAMAEETLPPQVHLSSLDPGVGKTTLVKHVIAKLIGSPDHEEVAVLVCLSLLDEVKKMQAQLNDLGVEVAIWTGNDEVNDRSDLAPDEARVLLTTQAKLRALAHHHRRFADMQGFHYLGQPRQVRIWDESLMPGQEVQLSADQLAALPQHLREPAPDLCETLDHLVTQLKEAKTGDLITVPELEEMGGLQGASEAHRLLQRDAEISPRDKEALLMLHHIAGRQLPVYKTNNGTCRLLSYRKTLPRDLAPMLVLDASGRCRHTYKLMAAQTGSLVRLPVGEKDYSQLQISWWDQGSGKSSISKDKDEVILRGVAEVIQQRLDEDWLVVIHKGQKRYFRDRLEAHLGGALTGNLHVVTWGSHHGTNAFADVPNVVLVSLLFLPPDTYESRVRLCAGMDRAAVVISAERKAMATGELLHDILQALCRARVRGVEADGRCPPCRAWIIAAKQTHLDRHLPTLFPGCQLKSWRPKGSTKLSGRIRQALNLIDQMEDEGFGGWFTFVELAEELGMTPKDFGKQVGKDRRFLEQVADRGYVVTKLERQTSKGPRMAKGIQRQEADFPVDLKADFTISG